MEKMTIDEMVLYAPDAPDLTVNSNRLLYLCNMLRELTEPGCGMTIDDICDVLEAKALEAGIKGYRPSRSTINKDLKAIRECEPLDITLHTPERGKNEGFWCESLALDNAQACMLINIVQACKFINQRQCNELVEALKRMVPTSEQDVIPRDVYVDSAVKTNNVNVFESLNVISRAMKAKRKVEFRYFHYDSGNKRIYLNGRGDGIYVETPVGIIFSNDAYYLETWGEYLNDLGRESNRYRLDRVCCMAVSTENADRGEHVNRLKKTVGERASMCVDMMGNGQTRYLALEVNKGTGLTAIKNKFGKHCYSFDSETDGVSVVLIKVKLSVTFYRWLFGHSENMKIVMPELSWHGRWVETSRDDVPFAKLLSDYRCAVEGFSSCLMGTLTKYEH